MPLRSMIIVVFALILVGTSNLVFGQNDTLIDPRNRFSNLNLSLPPQSWPVLQRDFLVQPDCGESSYIGRARLRGRRALITGGDSGIGRAIAIAFAREGASVAINYLPQEEPDAQDLADFLNTEGRNLTRIPGDLLNETFCGALITEANRRLGGLDILVNHAGFAGNLAGPGNALISNHSTSQFDRVFRTNVYAPFFLTRAAVPLMSPGSSIIFTASNVAANPIPDGIDYSATKAALVNIARGLAVQLAPFGIRVNAVAPGMTYTPFLAASGYTTGGMLEQAASSPTQRMEQPVELAPLYVDFAESSNTYTSGSIWGAYGGRGGF